MTTISGTSSVLLTSGSQNTSGGRPPKMDPDELKAKLTADFGEEVASSVVSDEGEIDFEALKSVLEANGIEGPKGGPGGAGGPPPGGPPPGLAQGSETDIFEIDEETLLEQIAADFGDDAASSITSDDGSVDFAKLKDLLDSQFAQANANSYTASGASGASAANSDLTSKLLSLLA